MRGKQWNLENIIRHTHSNELFYDVGAKAPMIVCRFDKHIAIELKRRAKKAGVSVAKIVRELVDNGLKLENYYRAKKEMRLNE